MCCYKQVQSFTWREIIKAIHDSLDYFERETLAVDVLDARVNESGDTLTIEVKSVELMSEIAAGAYTELVLKAARHNHPRIDFLEVKVKQPLTFETTKHIDAAFPDISCV